MEFKKLSKAQKWYLKYTNRKAYEAYKAELFRQRNPGFADLSAGIPHPNLNHPYKAVTTFKHSGNCGDIIYSLPAAFELAKNGEAHFFLQTNQPADYQDNVHPLGNVMLNHKMVEMLTPLLLHQPRINSVKSYNGEAVDYELDLFRRFTFLLDRGSIVRWYATVFGINYNTTDPWLTAPTDESYKKSIVIARSQRYRSPVVDYGFLREYPNKVFIGIEEEYNDMRQWLPDMEYKPVTDFLEMATVINSCRLFIGNQSFPFAIAEALKVNRLLEVYYKIPNVIVEGRGANDFMYQPQFEYAVKRLLGEQPMP